MKAEQCAKAGISYYWPVEQPPAGVPVVYTYVLDPAAKAYRGGEIFAGLIDASAPFPIKVDVTRL